MALLDDLLTWSHALPNWQQDALRRHFASEQLTEDDFQALLHFLKVAHGAAASDGSIPVPLSINDIQAGASGATVLLHGLNNLTNVNGFPAGRSLAFAPHGMTVIFGENGAGKSGYARVLKNACRARKKEPVRANAFDDNRSGQVPRADIDLEASGARRTFSWTQGGSVDVDLGSISVYDAVCANDYIEEEGSPAFQPYGLAQVVAFAKTCSELERRINSEIAALPRNSVPFQGLIGETGVGHFIRALGHTSDVATARSLGTVSEIEAARVVELTGILAELNPEPKAQLLQRLATRVGVLATNATQAHAFTTDRAVERLQGLVQTNLDAGAAHLASQQLLQGQDVLPGTGSAVWRLLFSAAQQYSTQLAYPGVDHPHLGNGARCVLCQSELSSEAKARMQSFSEFVSSSTATAADAASAALQEAKGKISQADFTLGVDEALLSEIKEVLPDLFEQLTEWQNAWDVRRTWMLSGAQSNLWNDRPVLPDGPSLDSRIHDVVVALRASAELLLKAIDPKQRDLYRSELGELKARQALSPHLPAVEQYIENSKKVEGLRACVVNLGTGPISRQLTAFADTYITQALIDAMQDELNKIGYQRRARHHIPRRTERGVTLVRVNLEGTTSRTEDVLSEGEQRATALAFFLAEMRLAGTGSTLVFDDPVTSMDHRYRRNVAKRLAQIANERQVIVFTHDAVFLTALYQSCNATPCSVAYRNIEWDSAPGRSNDGLGWDHMKSGQRMNELKQRLSSIKSKWGDYPSEESKREMTNIYSHLRGTIERIIREDLINSVIQPYSDEVKVENFAAVIGIDQAEWDSFLEVYDHACEVTRAHDTTSEQQLEIPSPDRLEADISVLEKVISSAKGRKSKASQARDERSEKRRIKLQ